jgi:hypothetical protein
MIQIVPLNIQKETPSGKEEYLKARCAKFEKVLKAGAPDRDTSQDERVKQEYIERLLMLAEGGTADFTLVPLEDSTASASAQSFKEKVDATFPLIDGETLIEEQIGRIGNRIYVKQATNLSTFCFTDTSFELGEEFAPAEQPPAPADGAAANNAQDEAEALQKIAKTVVDIGKGLVKVVPAPYGSVLSGAFEGLSTYLSLTSTSQVAKDTEKTINRISELVGKLTWKANVQQTVKEQAGAINSIIEELTETYGPRKTNSKANDTRKELIDRYLNPFRDGLNKAINTLAQDDFDIASLPEYCMAAGAYFCVLQELAVLDSDCSDDPFKSTYCDELKNKKVPRCIDHVNQTYEKIINKAKESVSSTTEYIYEARLFRKIYACCGSSPKCETFDKAGAWY